MSEEVQESDVSSAKMRQTLNSCSAMSIYIRKNKGPKTEPCGTPAFVDFVLDTLDTIHFKRFPFIPFSFSLNSRPLIYTLSNAVETSQNTMQVCFFILCTSIPDN